MRTMRSEGEGLRQKQHKRMRSDIGSLKYRPKTNNQAEAATLDASFHRPFPTSHTSMFRVLSELVTGSKEAATALGSGASCFSAPRDEAVASIGSKRLIANWLRFLPVQ